MPRCVSCGHFCSERMSVLLPKFSTPQHAKLKHKIKPGGKANVCQKCFNKLKQGAAVAERKTSSMSVHHNKTCSENKVMEPPLPKCSVNLARLLICESCCFHTESQTVLASHILSHQPSVEPCQLPKCQINLKKLFSCVNCSFHTSNQAELATHMQARHAGTASRPTETENVSCVTEMNVDAAAPVDQENCLPQNNAQPGTSCRPTETQDADVSCTTEMNVDAAAPVDQENCLPQNIAQPDLHEGQVKQEPMDSDDDVKVSYIHFESPAYKLAKQRLHTLAASPVMSEVESADVIVIQENSARKGAVKVEPNEKHMESLRACEQDGASTGTVVPNDSTPNVGPETQQIKLEPADQPDFLPQDSGSHSGEQEENSASSHLETCDQCGITFTCKHLLTWHTDNCHGLRPTVKVVSFKSSKYFQCLICKIEIFRSHKKLVHHIWAQHKQVNQPYHCQFCLQQFDRSYAQEKHQKLCHAPKVKPKQVSKCTICFRIYRSESLLKAHIPVCHHLHCFKCGQCGENFKSMLSLENHCCLMHSSVNCNKCNVCGCSKEFLVRIAFVSKHQVYACVICSTIVFTTQLLNANYNQPHNSVQLKCHFCHLTFISRQHLKLHYQRIHTGRILICDICQFNTHSKKKLTKHLMYDHFFYDP